MNRHFFQRKHTNSQWAYEKMVNISNHLGNANQNHSELSYAGQIVYYQKDKQVCGEKGTLEHHWWEANSCSHCGKQYGSSSKNNNRSIIQSRNSNFGYLEIKSFILKMRNADQRDAETLKSSTWTWTNIFKAPGWGVHSTPQLLPGQQAIFLN